MAARVLMVPQSVIAKAIRQHARDEGADGKIQVYVTCDAVVGDKAEVRGLAVWDDEGGPVPDFLTEEQRAQYKA